MKKYYCTKWVLSLGIVEFKGEVSDVGGEERTYISSKRTASETRHIFEKLGVNVFETLEAAKIDAVKKAVKNIHAKEKALDKARKTLQKFHDGKFKVTT